jgi:hypothetical protein
MARTAFIPTPAIREKVRRLSGLGVPQDDIAKIVGCAPKTLRKHLRAELHLGKAETKAAMAGYLFNAAKAGKVAAMIFWLKTRAGWREKPLAHAGNGDSAVPTQQGVVRIYIPVDESDPELAKALYRGQQQGLKGWGKKERRQPRNAKRHRPAVDISAIQAGDDWGLGPDTQNSPERSNELPVGSSERAALDDIRAPLGGRPAPGEWPDGSGQAW